MNIKLWTRENLAWAAGFLEGEGCFTVYGAGSIRMAASQHSRNPCPLLKLKEMFGGGITTYIATKGTFDVGGKMNSWFLHNKTYVYPVIVALYPFMSERRKRDLEKLIEFFRKSKRKGYKVKAEIE